MTLPILYSFRRCPYAMRARMAIAASKQNVQLREIVLKHKPAELLAISPNKTIPVLQITEADITPQVIDESLEIMVWALSNNDPEQWLNASLQEMLAFIDINDFEFKPWLDKYKYSDRHPEYTQTYYREQAEEFLILLEMRLSVNKYLFADYLTLADIAIFPFIRQFASVDQQWFEQNDYPLVQKWLTLLINSELFIASMKKYPTWLESGEAFLFPDPVNSLE